MTNGQIAFEQSEAWSRRDGGTFGRVVIQWTRNGGYAAPVGIEYYTPRVAQSITDDVNHTPGGVATMTFVQLAPNGLPKMVA